MTERKNPGYWNSKENCRKAAKECSSRTEFNARFTGAYLKSMYNGWLNEFFPESSYVGRDHWTKENCMREAQKYNTRSEFAKGCDRAYRVSLENGWLPEFGLYGVKKCYTLDECIELVNSCKTRWEFSKNYTKAYRYAKTQGWLPELFKDYPEIGNKKKEEYRKIAIECKTSRKFRQKSKAKFIYALKHGWIEEFFPNEKPHSVKPDSIRSKILDYVEQNGPQTKREIYRIMLAAAGQPTHLTSWGISYVNNTALGQTVFLPAPGDTRWLKPVKSDGKKPLYGIAYPIKH